jgi:glycosyltransferase involved in cell wall biosynthesis
MSTLSVIVITLNEARHIAACLESVAWADEIVVVDAESSDETVAIARQYTGKVFVEKFRGYSGQKNFALDQARGEWILWLDADERVSPGLAEEIRRTIAARPLLSGYEMPRKAYFLGHWIKHCGWYPGHVLRLFRRERGRFDERQVHETLLLQGIKGRLRGDLEHHTDDSLEHYFWKFNRYTSLAASELARRGKPFGMASVLGRPLHAFIKMYLLKRGFLDGLPGLVLCLLSANYVVAKYAKVVEGREQPPGKEIPAGRVPGEVPETK